MFKKTCFLLAAFFISIVSFAQNYDVIIIGGGASGTAAGLASARNGANTLIIEEGPWLGGMLTSAGVSAIDGNHRLPSGIWGEFRAKLIEHYGSQQAMSTGWVSNTLFEPKVGNQIFQQLVAETKGLEVNFNTHWKSADYINGLWKVNAEKNGQSLEFWAPILIDATELGDVAASLGVPYRLGMDARDEIGEAFAPEQANDIVQDLTYVVTLKDFGQGSDKTIPKPANYDPAEFACACAHADPITDEDPTLDCQKMLDYGKLPNGKYMINWPNCGNDHYVNLVELSPEEREKELEKAKQTS
ncbi:MAG: FAD-dependent oxidoreductase, partial [Cyclobacteriaceae bacterium]|nr:FAD-dependent oxidoreductase [Cyclobacteriaceae bacterium]